MTVNGTGLVILWPLTLAVIMVLPWISIPVMLVLNLAWRHKDSWPVALLFLPLTFAAWMWIGWSLWNYRPMD
jgi:hypothetical protein